MIFALATPMIVGGAAFSVETSYDYYKHQRLAAAADAAAYAGALELANGSTQSVVTQTATSTATSNGWLQSSGTIQVYTPPSSGSHISSKAVEVILTENEPRFFTALFVNTPVALRRRAVAQFQANGDACIVALNRSASRAITATGSSSMSLNGCDVASDSSASDAIFTWGSSSVTADCALSAGGIQNNGAMSLSGCPGGLTGVTPVADPFSSLPTPSPTGPCLGGNVNGGTISAGYYCNGLSLKGNVSLNPGVYYVSGGNFQVNANARVSGTGVTIYLSGSARVSMQGNSDTQLWAPTSGTYSGILFFGDRTNNGSVTNTFNGDAASRLTGSLYFPSESVTYTGNFSGQNGCTYVVADTVTWSGSTNFSVDCTAQGMAKIPARNAIALVE